MRKSDLFSRIMHCNTTLYVHTADKSVPFVVHRKANFLGPLGPSGRASV